MGYNMKGFSGFVNSPLTKKAGPETKQFDVDEDITQRDFEDREYAIEYAINDNDLPDGKHPTEKQIKKALDYIQAERKAGY